MVLVLAPSSTLKNHKALTEQPAQHIIVILANYMWHCSDTADLLSM
jgi:hypothetical protein